jgi:hypothetical protein
MYMPSYLAETITEKTLKCKSLEMIEELRVGSKDSKNELLFFVKPEVFLLKDKIHISKTVDLILSSIKKFDAKIDGMYAVDGATLEKYNIMSKHYGFINVMSNSASKTVDQESKKKISDAYNIPVGSFEILGGHEYLKKYMTENADTLDKIWFEDKSVKIRSGFYVRHLKKDGKDIILVNGFHPKQIAYFTNPAHKILLILLHSNTEWTKLKNNMVGATFPEKAVPESIRGILYKDAKEYGFDAVTIANNCTHISAGPFEGMYEIINFFGKLAKFDPKRQQPVTMHTMLADGISWDNAMTAVDNPIIQYNGKAVDLFTATEDMDTDKAVPIFKEGMKKG